MAGLPTDGGSEGTHGAELNEFILVGHDADGTLKKSQALTDLEYSPTDYANDGSSDSRESVTFPNGLIFKNGVVAATTNGTKTITFATAFPNGVVSFNAIARVSAGDDASFTVLGAPTVNSFQIQIGNENNMTHFYWQAWGY